MTMQSALILLLLTILSGYADARGFLHAADIWGQGTLQLGAALRSGLYFMVGIPLYWLTIRFLPSHHTVPPELQAALWFVVTLIGVAVMSGRFFTWPGIDRVVACLVVCGVVYLMLRVGA